MVGPNGQRENAPGVGSQEPAETGTGAARLERRAPARLRHLKILSFWIGSTVCRSEPSGRAVLSKIVDCSPVHSFANLDKLTRKLQETIATAYLERSTEMKMETRSSRSQSSDRSFARSFDSTSTRNAASSRKHFYNFAPTSLAHASVLNDLGRSMGAPRARSMMSWGRTPMARETPKRTV